MFTDLEKSHIIACKAKIENLVDTLKIPHQVGTIIAGGVFTSIFNNEPYKDIDLFILADCRFYTPTPNSKKQNNSEYLTKNNSNIEHVYFNEELKVNTIFTKYKTRKDVINHFDFAHCCVSYDFKHLYISHETYTSIKNKKLVVNNPAMVQTYRRDKFIKKGFTE